MNHYFITFEGRLKADPRSFNIYFRVIKSFTTNGAIHSLDKLFNNIKIIEIEKFEKTA